jgi:hypothetical protein
MTRLASSRVKAIDDLPYDKPEYCELASYVKLVGEDGSMGALERTNAELAIIRRMTSRYGRGRRPRAGA